MIDRAVTIAYRAIRMAVAQSGLPERQHTPVALYLLVVVCGVPGAAAATAAGCTKQNVSKSVRGVEERREDASFDLALTRLEEIGR